MPLDPVLELPNRAVLILTGMGAVILLAISAAWAVAIDRARSGRPLVPDREGGPVRWGGREALVCFAAWQVATLVASQVLRSRRGDVGEPDLLDAIAAVALINLVLIVVLPGLLAVLSGASLADLGFRRGVIAQDAGLGFFAALVAIPIVYAVQFAAILVWPPTAHPLQELVAERPSPGVMVLALVSAVVLAPAAEELLFRGILQGWLERRLHLRRARDASEAAWPGGEEGGFAGTAPVGGDRAADRMAIGFPAAFFAAVHAGQWPAPIPLFVLALGLGLLYRRTKGIVAPIAMHATFNGLSTLVMIVVVLVVPAGDAPAPSAPDDAGAPALGPPEVPETPEEEAKSGSRSD